MDFRNILSTDELLMYFQEVYKEAASKEIILKGIVNKYQEENSRLYSRINELESELNMLKQEDQNEQ